MALGEDFVVIRPERAFDLGFELEGSGGRVLQGGTITSVEGIRAGAGATGLRGSGSDDVALVVSETAVGVSGAGVFTQNKAKAAPVVVSERTLSGGEAIYGIVANSGCANALTGKRGLCDAEEMQRAAADKIGVPPESVLVASTGLIGTFLPIDSVKSAISDMEPSASEEAGHRAARAIMTTDTVPKECAVEVTNGDGSFTVGAIAKGAAMLEPSMATMLAFLATDASLDAASLRRILARSVSKTFNRLSVDACISTNDCVLALATSATPPGGSRGADSREQELAAIQRAFDYVCASLALQMARDAEGSCRVAVLRVRGAASRSDAERVARGIAASSLVRCSLYGGDPYWGRVVAEAGAVAEVFDPRSVSVTYGPFVVCAGGVATEVWRSDALAEYMSAREVEISCDLGVGPFEAVRVMASLGPGYVDENMRTS